MGGVHSRTPEKSHSNCLIIAIRNIYIWAHDMAPPSACVTNNNIHEHTWTALGCRPNSTCKADGLLLSWRLASPRFFIHVGVTTMERLDHTKLEVLGMTCFGRESNPGLYGGRQHSSHSNSLIMAIRNIYISTRDSTIISRRTQHNNQYDHLTANQTLQFALPVSFYAKLNKKQSKRSS